MEMEDSVNVLQFAKARAAEIMTLMENVTSKEGKLTLQRLPYHMRRRAASHNPKRLPRNLRIKKADETPAKPKRKRKCHKNLLEEYNSRQKPDKLWLPTHIWFAKRFHMKNMWGYQLPFQATGKRFRSSYRATLKSALLEDLSYFCCIELRGEQEKLLTKLSLLTDDSLGMNFASESYIDGTREGNCFLFQPHSFPYHAIGPVSFIWNPACSISSSDFNITDKSSRQLWIWCHPTIYNEITKVLIDIFHLTQQEESSSPKKFEFASKTNYMKTKLHFQKEPVYSSDEAKMIVLKDTLIRHRLIGPNVLPILTSVLKLADSSYNLNQSKTNLESASDNDTNMPDCITLKQSESIFETEEEDIILSKRKVWNYLTESKSSYSVPMKTVIGLTVDDPRIYVTPKDSNFSRYGNSDMQDISPEEFCNPSVALSDLWDSELRNDVTSSQVPEHVINSERAKFVKPNASDLQKCTTKVPVLLIYQPAVKGYGSGWDIIAPQGWGMAFWIPFIYHGAQPAGFDDFCSINLESGSATFPISFPDTTAGAEFEENTRESSLKKFYKYSRAKRPNFKVLGVVAPFFMPWNILVSDWEKEFLDQYATTNTNEPKTEDLFNDLNITKEGDFFTLRMKNEVLHLQQLCLSLNKTKKQPSYESINELRMMQSRLVQDLIAQNIYLKCLIAVRVQCFYRGTPFAFSGIYLPKESDLELLKENPKYFGPVESQHSQDAEYLDMPVKKRRKMMKEEAKIESKNLGRPTVETIISKSDYKMIGYIAEGGYSRFGGHGCGVGHCVLTGFLAVIDICLNKKMSATVLIREQHNFQYRPASVEVMQNLF